MARSKFALDFQPDHEKEDTHEQIVDYFENRQLNQVPIGTKS